MLLPSLRKRLRTVSGKNQSLQDILRTLNDSTEILSIQPQLRGIHNTSIVLKVDLGDNHEPSTRYDTRVHFYNRLPLANVLVGLDYTGTAIEQIIAKLNIQGCDFNEDDLELVDGVLKAKPFSLGYIGSVERGEEPIPVFYALLDHQGLGQPSVLSLSLTQTIHDGPGDEAGTEVVFDKIVITLKHNGNTYERIHVEGDGWEPPYDSNKGGTTGPLLAQMMSDNNVYDKLSLMLSSQDTPYTMLQNLTTEPSTFEFTVRSHYNFKGKAVVRDDLHMGKFSLLPLGERIVPPAHIYLNVKLLAKDELGLIPTGSFNQYIDAGQVLQGRVQSSDWVTIDPKVLSGTVDGEELTNAVYELCEATGHKGVAYYSRSNSLLLNEIRNYTGDTLQIELRSKKPADDRWTIFYQMILGTRVSSAQL